MEGEGALEALGEQLYHLIYPKHADIAGKLTGKCVMLYHYIFFIGQGYIHNVTTITLSSNYLKTWTNQMTVCGVVCFRHVVGAARPCAESDAAGRGPAG